MGFNLLTNLKTCYDIIKDTVPVSMVYYSHIPSAIVSLLIGTFVILKNRKMVGWLVFFIAVFFSLWSFTEPETLAFCANEEILKRNIAVSKAINFLI